MVVIATSSLMNDCMRPIPTLRAGPPARLAGTNQMLGRPGARCSTPRPRRGAAGVAPQPDLAGTHSPKQYCIAVDDQHRVAIHGADQ
jgi:hypothetical protein